MDDDVYECTYCAAEIEGVGNYPESDFCAQCIENGEHLEDDDEND